jgi:hypothetical protein
MDYQVWCGPAMGAFNEWAAGTFLEDPSRRTVSTVALNILYGAAELTHANILRYQGQQDGLESSIAQPREDIQIKEYLS